MEQNPESVQATGPAMGEITISAVIHDCAKPGKTFGNYHVMRVIGEGGMGTVYEAMQENPRRPVALKTLKDELMHPRAIRRFEYESQILARLHHPGIAQIYEAGMQVYDGKSVPFFAMEFINKALPIDKYVKEKCLSVREILTLFVGVCRAVHHGHQKGIIHRDLKPGNILVDGDGNTKVIDFGVARTADSDMVLSAARTRAGEMLGTLKYMSPEQCQPNPNDIDTRSDIYALGVVLYELLTGHVPYDLTAVSMGMIPRIICEVEPTSPQTYNRSLRGDVESILLTTLAKDRNRRYDSCHALAMDIERYLKGEPILARPPSFGYLLKKFARKRWRGLAAAMVIVVAVASAGFAFSRAQEAERQAAVNQALEHLMNAQMAVNQDAYDDLISESSRAIELNPRLAPAYALRCLASLRFYNWNAAIKDCNKALELDPTNALALRKKGTILMFEGDLDKALDYFDRGIAGVFGGDVIRFEQSLAEDFHLRALMLRRKMRFDQALLDHDKAIALAEHVAETHVARGITRRMIGDIDGAIADLKKGVEISPEKWTMTVHSWIWEMLMLRAQPGDREVAEQVLAAAADYAETHESPLDRMIVGTLTGTVSAEEASSAAGPPWLSCVVPYYLGVKRLIEGNTSEAIAYLERSANSGVHHLGEHEFAIWHLRRLNPEYKPPDEKVDLKRLFHTQ